MRLQSERAQWEADNSTQRELSGFEHVEEVLNGPPRRGRGRGRGRGQSQGEGVASGEAIQSIEVDGVGLLQAFQM